MSFYEGEDDNVTPNNDKRFELFWKTFPASDKFLAWPETRKLRTVKKDTYKAYLKALQDGHTPELIQKALERDVLSRRDTPSRENPFKYMKGSKRWLEDQVFLEVEEPAPIKYANDILM